MESEDEPETEDLRVVTAPEEAAGERLDRWLATVFEALSRSRLKHLIENGRVWRDDVREVDASAKVRAGSVYRIGIPAPVSAEPEAEDIPLTVLYEDAHLLVIDKPAGLSVHPAPGNWTGTLVNAVLHHAGASLRVVGATGRPGIVHRLDKDTSGVMVVCKSEFAMTSLGRQFANRTVDRRYRALVVGCPKPREGRVEARLARDPNDRKKMAVIREDATAGKSAVTNYKVTRLFGVGPDACEIECKLETGRTHQIRVHMAHIGCPLIGDGVYGGTRSAKALDRALESLDLDPPPVLHRQALHAASLAFTHPATDERLRFETDWPADMDYLSRGLALLSPRMGRP